MPQPAAQVDREVTLALEVARAVLCGLGLFLFNGGTGSVTSTTTVTISNNLANGGRGGDGGLAGLASGAAGGAGSFPLGNGGDGIQLNYSTTNNTIGGTTAAAGNIISANGGSGVCGKPKSLGKFF